MPIYIIQNAYYILNVYFQYLKCLLTSFLMLIYNILKILPLFTQCIPFDFLPFLGGQIGSHVKEKNLIFLNFNRGKVGLVSVKV